MREYSQNQGLQNLEIFKIAEVVSDLIWKEVAKWELFTRDCMGGQIVRSADSIGSNISEAYGRYHFKDRLNFLYYARGSLLETDTRWRKAVRRGITSPEQNQNIDSKLSELAPKLNGFIRSVRYESRSKDKKGTGISEPEAPYGVKTMELDKSQIHK